MNANSKLFINHNARIFLKMGANLAIDNKSVIVLIISENYIFKIYVNKSIIRPKAVFKFIVVIIQPYDLDTTI